jgi:hypothetical protein
MAIAVALLAAGCFAASALLPGLGGGTPRSRSFAIAVAAGVLAYMGASHLLPEAQAEHPSRAVGVVFTAKLALTLVVLRLAPSA